MHQWVRILIEVSDNAEWFLFHPNLCHILLRINISNLVFSALSSTPLLTTDYWPARLLEEMGFYPQPELQLQQRHTAAVSISAALLSTLSILLQYGQ